MELAFEWDEAKAVSNVAKHDVSFEEALTVFSDRRSITIYDVEHSEGEERFIDIGQAASGRLLVVVYSERGVNIRIISSRRANAAERRQYEQ